MEYLHAHQIMHPDLKPGNILLNKRYRPKLADFGRSKFIPPEEAGPQTTFASTPIYMAPERITGDQIGFKADVYSFGLVIYAVMEGKEPFYENDGTAPPSTFVLQARVISGERPSFSARLQRSPLADLARECWAPDPETRPTFSEILHRLSDESLLDSIPNLDHEEFRAYERSLPSPTLHHPPVLPAAPLVPVAALPVVAARPMPNLGNGQQIPNPGNDQPGANPGNDQLLVNPNPPAFGGRVHRWTRMAVLTIALAMSGHVPIPSRVVDLFEMVEVSARMAQNLPGAQIVAW
jgi:serine/threonine protein kinase